VLKRKNTLCPLPRQGFFTSQANVRESDAPTKKNRAVHLGLGSASACLSFVNWPAKVHCDLMALSRALSIPH
jgi:hypothetical protein